MSSCKHAEEIGCEGAICFDCLMREEFQKRDKRIAELVLELASETGKRMEIARQDGGKHNIAQMIRDRIENMKHEDGYVPINDVINEIDRVCRATGNKCDDDSLWFTGKDWQAWMCPEERQSLCDEVCRLERELARAREVLISVCNIPQAAPEIHPLSYSHDEVCRLMVAANESYQILNDTIKESATGGEVV